MDLQLQGRVVGITGGATGIGKACALRYLQEGCKVAVYGRTREKLDAFAEECKAAGYDDVLCCAVDVTDSKALESAVEETVRRFGRIDVWFNNAGVGVRKPLLDLAEEEWDAVMGTNLRSAFIASRLVGRLMIEQKRGVIVNACSFTSRIPVAGHGPYSVSKWGLSAFSRVLAAELAPHNIRVFSFVPGMIRTEITRDRFAANEAYFAKQCVLQRVGEADELAPVLVMLTSDLASYVTGCEIEISGGKFCVQNPEFAWQTP